jgi:hypothetical protein
MMPIFVWRSPPVTEGGGVSLTNDVLDLETISTALLTWLSDTALPASDNIDTLVSPAAATMLEPHIGADATHKLQTMLYDIAAVFTGRHIDTLWALPSTCLENVPISSPRRVLEYLERVLITENFRDCSRERLLVFFILLVTTMLSISLTPPSLEPESVVEKGKRSNRASWEH